jgi:drug/metabolite transporter superfamily protein YnfA
MNGSLGRGIGIVVFAAGAIFTLQGVGILKGSSMSNTTTWTVAGPIIALVGAAVFFRANRKGGGPGPSA